MMQQMRCASYYANEPWCSDYRLNTLCEKCKELICLSFLFYINMQCQEKLDNHDNLQAIFTFFM
jgi:hypothetical protein